MPANHAHLREWGERFRCRGASFASIRVIRGPSIASTYGSPDQAAAHTQDGERDDGRNRCGAGGNERNDDEAENDCAKDGHPKPPPKPLAEDIEDNLKEGFKHGGGWGGDLEPSHGGSYEFHG